MSDITIITVCLNAENEIEKTIQSVLEQRDVTAEYLIIDGRSSDHTLEIANAYKPSFERKKFNYRIVSEKDEGIYDAMNKGALLAKGEWVLFLNAGDYLYYNECLKDVERKLSQLNSDIVYGDALYQYYSAYRPFHAKPIKCITKQYVFCHQSLFMKTELLRTEKYDLKYHICADYELCVRCFQKGKTFTSVSIPVAVYNCEGYSSRNFNMDSRLERLRVRYDRGIISKKTLALRSFGCRAFRFIPGFFEKILPRRIITMIIKPILLAKGWSKSFIPFEDFYG